MWRFPRNIKLLFWNVLYVGTASSRTFCKTDVIIRSEQYAFLLNYYVYTPTNHRIKHHNIHIASRLRGCGWHYIGYSNTSWKTGHSFLPNSSDTKTQWCSLAHARQRNTWDIWPFETWRNRTSSKRDKSQTFSLAMGTNPMTRCPKIDFYLHSRPHNLWLI